MKQLIAALVLILATASAMAAPRTVVLAVPTMTCATCPLTVKLALNGVDGVIDTEVSWDPKEARVTFDDSKVTIEALLEATANAGYRSMLKE